MNRLARRMSRRGVFFGASFAAFVAVGCRGQANPARPAPPPSATLAPSTPTMPATATVLPPTPTPALPTDTAVPATNTSVPTVATRSVSAPSDVTGPLALPTATTGPQSAGAPTSKFFIPSAVALLVSVSPTPTHKGVANSNVDQVQYVRDVATDLQVMAKSLQDMIGLVDYIQHHSSLSTADQTMILQRFTQDDKAIQGAYAREEARDYPPNLKDVDDNYAETIRYASRFADTFLKIMQTGNETYLSELQSDASKFQFFAKQLQTVVEAHQHG